MKTERGYCGGDRYQFDFAQCSFKNGWAQIDREQDAPYFGTWAHVETLQILSFLEGDYYLQTCENGDEFAQEIREIKEFDESNGWKFGGIDPACQPEMIERFESMGLEDLLH